MFVTDAVRQSQILKLARADVRNRNDLDALRYILKHGG